MVFESLLVALLLGGGLLLLSRREPGARSRVVAGAVLAGCVGLPALAVWQRDAFYPVDRLGELGVTGRPIEVPDADEGYVTSRACQACHPSQYASWNASYHRKMTQLPRPDTVIGRFDGEPFEVKGSTYLFERVGDEYWVDIEDPDWHRRVFLEQRGGAELHPESLTPRRIRRPVAMTTGSHNKQVYWYPGDEGRLLGQLDVYWLPEAQRWIPRRSGFLIAPSELHGAETGRWNTSCIRCHAVDGRPRQEGEQHFDTHVSELGIACESCHGPGGPHVEAQRNPLRRYGAHLGADDAHGGGAGGHDIVNPSKLPFDRGTEVCGQCHGLYEFQTPFEAQDFTRDGFAYKPGDDLSKDRLVLRYEDPPKDPRVKGFVKSYPFYWENRFWEDGQVRMAGREYTALLETPCFQAGAMTCLSCHSMHKGADDPRPHAEWAVDQLKPGMDGDRACLQCHTEYAADIPAHTNHALGSPGSECLNCHMAFSAYGLLKVERSHLVNSPDTAVDLATGRPNACNLCHLDKPLGWTADALHEWYGTPKPAFDPEQAGVAVGVRNLLTGDAQQRVLIAQAMGWEAAREASGDDWMAPYLAHLMGDPYDVIRYISHRSLSRQAAYQGVAFDFLADEAARDAVRAAVRATWEGLAAGRADTGTGRGADPAVLLDAAGALIQDVFDALAARRDDRPVNLQE